MAVAILPVAAVLALFSYDILLLWTRNPEIARNAATIARVLTVGTTLNGLMVLPYALQLAHGWTSIGLRMNIFLVLTLVPAIWILTTHYGAIGGASAYLAMTCVYMALGVPLTHRRLLRGQARRWFVEDIGLATMAVLLVVGVARAVITHTAPSLMAALVLCMVFIAAELAGVLAAPQVRSQIVAELSKIRLGYA
jgi:hypothetical protein